MIELTCWHITREYMTQDLYSSYFLRPLTKPTRFSITPSRASFSFKLSSFLTSQYSNTELAFVFRDRSVLTCSFSSASSYRSKTSSVVVHISTAPSISNSGAGGGPFGMVLVLRGFGAPVFESIDVVDSLGMSLNLSMTELALGEDARFMFGSTSLFCFDGGNISSRSTGTPRDTRKSLRIRLLVQFGGCMGGGETSCCHNESDLSDKNADGGCISISDAGFVIVVSSGKMEVKYASTVFRRVSSEEKSSSGCRRSAFVSY